MKQNEQPKKIKDLYTELGISRTTFWRHRKAFDIPKFQDFLKIEDPEKRQELVNQYGSDEIKAIFNNGNISMNKAFNIATEKNKETKGLYADLYLAVYNVLDEKSKTLGITKAKIVNDCLALMFSDDLNLHQSSIDSLINKYK